MHKTKVSILMFVSIFLINNANAGSPKELKTDKTETTKAAVVGAGVVENGCSNSNPISIPSQEQKKLYKELYYETPCGLAGSVRSVKDKQSSYPSSSVKSTSPPSRADFFFP